MHPPGIYLSAGLARPDVSTAVGRSPELGLRYEASLFGRPTQVVVIVASSGRASLVALPTNEVHTLAISSKSTTTRSHSSSVHAVPD